MGHLAWADAFVITADSVSMLSEACSTGYVYCMMRRINLLTVFGEVILLN
jgi:mitochondrial fission protein ELM1